MTKNEIRQRLNEQRNRLKAKDQEDLSREILIRLLQTDAYKSCEMIFPYMSFRSEVDTKGIIKQSLLDGKKVFLSRVKKKEMDFYEIHDLNGLISSHYGIAEPPDEESIRYKEIDENITQNDRERFQNIFKSEQKENNRYRKLMLLPGLAFDLTGNRIGYGAGFYDRYLEAHKETMFYKIALAYDFQVIENIKADEFDIKADAVLTPKKLILCKKSL